MLVSVVVSISIQRLSLGRRNRSISFEESTLFMNKKSWLIMQRFSCEVLPCTTNKLTATRLKRQHRRQAQKSKVARHRAFEFDLVLLWRKLRDSWVCRLPICRYMAAWWFYQWPLSKVELSVHCQAVGEISISWSNNEDYHCNYLMQCVRN